MQKRQRDNPMASTVLEIFPIALGRRVYLGNGNMGRTLF